MLEFFGMNTSPSTIPPSEKMFAKNIPELKGKSLCLFLVKMDQNEGKIQAEGKLKDRVRPKTKRANEEKLIQKYIDKRRNERLVDDGLAGGIGILGGTITGLAVGGPVGGIVGGVGCALAGVGWADSTVTHYYTAKECGKEVAKPRVNRLRHKAKCIDNKLANLSKSDNEQQLQIAKKHFEEMVAVYKNIRKKSSTSARILGTRYDYWSNGKVHYTRHFNGVETIYKVPGYEVQREVEYHESGVYSDSD